MVTTQMEVQICESGRWKAFISAGDYSPLREMMVGLCGGYEAVGKDERRRIFKVCQVAVKRWHDRGWFFSSRSSAVEAQKPDIHAQRQPGSIVLDARDVFF